MSQMDIGQQAGPYPGRVWRGSPRRLHGEPMAGASPAAARAFSESELRLLDWLNGMSQHEFVEWFRSSFEPSLHPICVVTACNHILGDRLHLARRPQQPVLGFSARWT